MRKDTCVRELCLKRVLARLGVAQSRVCCPTCGAENKCTCEESCPSRSKKKKSSTKPQVARKQQHIHVDRCLNIPARKPETIELGTLWSRTGLDGVWRLQRCLPA